MAKIGYKWPKLPIIALNDQKWPKMAKIGRKLGGFQMAQVWETMRKFLSTPIKAYKTFLSQKNQYYGRYDQIKFTGFHYYG